jgi:uncharacterized protein
MSLEFIIIGLVVGLLVGLTGVGGASLLTPILIFMGVQPTMAIGTDFMYNFITKAAGSYQHIKQKTVNFKLVKYTAIGSLPTAAITNILFYFILGDSYNEDVLLFILGCVLVITSLLTLFQSLSRRPQNIWKGRTITEKKGLIILSGMLIGIVVGLTSVGGGSLFALIMLFLFNIKSSELVGSDISHAFLLSMVTALLMAGYGKVDYGLTINLLCGSIPGTIIGSKLTLQLPSRVIRVIIVTIIFFSGIKLIT